MRLRAVQDERCGLCLKEAPDGNCAHWLDVADEAGGSMVGFRTCSAPGARSTDSSRRNRLYAGCR